jgi:hypothetical protein
MITSFGNLTLASRVEFPKLAIMDAARLAACLGATARPLCVSTRHLKWWIRGGRPKCNRNAFFVFAGAGKR